MWVQDADIIILEFAFNDNFAGITLQSPERAAYERVRRAGWLLALGAAGGGCCTCSLSTCRATANPNPPTLTCAACPAFCPPPPQLVRRVLGFPAAPAVIAMHFFAYWHSKPSLDSPGPALYYNTGEDDLAVIGQYYDLPVLSVRCASLLASSQQPAPLLAALSGRLRACQLEAARPAVPGRLPLRRVQLAHEHVSRCCCCLCLAGLPAGMLQSTTCTITTQDSRCASSPPRPDSN